MYYENFLSNFAEISDLRILCENLYHFRYQINDGIVVKIVRLLLILTFVCHTDVLLVGVAGHIVPPVVHIVCLHTVQSVERIKCTLFRCRLLWLKPISPPPPSFYWSFITFILVFLSVSRYR